MAFIMDPLGRADSLKDERMSLDIAFELFGWGKDDWPSENEVQNLFSLLVLYAYERCTS